MVQHTHVTQWECVTCPAVGRCQRFMHVLKLKHVSCPEYLLDVDALKVKQRV